MSRFNPVDLVLFARALPFARLAQRVRTESVPFLVSDLFRRGGGFGDYPVERLARAADRATGRWAAWFGGMNTCLVRSLVLGALLADRGDVVLNVGFRPDEDPVPRLDGHAWLTVDGQPVGRDGDLAGARFTRVLEVPYGGSATE